MTNLIGRHMVYLVGQSEKRKGTIYNTEHNKELGKTLYHCVSPFGNVFRLSREEFELVEKEECFVCDLENSLKADRGSMSHPISCKWRQDRERNGYAKALQDIIDVLHRTSTSERDGDLKEIHNIAFSGLMKRYDIEEGV